MDKVDKAIRFAAQAHDGQYRKLTNIPYITHPFAVGMLLKDSDCTEAVIASGILHDVVEDTVFTLEDIQRLFGEDVARIVEGCSEPNKDWPWEERKTHTIDFLRTASFEIKIVAAADKLHNLSSTLEEMKAGENDDVWGRFKRGKTSQEWYYRNVYESIMRGLSLEQRDNPIFAQLKRVINEVFV